MSESAPLWVGIFSVVIAMFAMVIAVAKALSIKPLIKNIEDVLRGLKITMHNMNDFLVNSRYEDKSHIEQADRSHNELHTVKRDVQNISTGVDVCHANTEKIKKEVDKIKEEVKDIHKGVDTCNKNTEKIKEEVTKISISTDSCNKSVEKILAKISTI